MNKLPTVSVSQVNRYVSLMIKKETKLQDLYIKGELSNFTMHHKTGHMYFTLKDDTSSIKGIMFAGYNKSLRFKPENGLAVVIRGSIQVYEVGGVYQVYAVEMQPDGIGDLYLAYEQLKKKLEFDGLFLQKRTIPPRPQNICIITATTGAALQDMINILTRRYPLVKITLIGALVQGKNASASISSALLKAQDTGADVIIFGRGGGSIEDLWAFNEEKTARAIFASKIPTISAIGHETDFTIADFVADLRAPTPSAAAELAVPDIRKIYEDLTGLEQGVKDFTLQKLADALALTENKELVIKSLSPKVKLSLAEEKLAGFKRENNSNMARIIYNKEKSLVNYIEVVDALSPLNTLARGYSIAYSRGEILKDFNQIKVGDEIELQLYKGKAKAKITHTGEGKDNL